MGDFISPKIATEVQKRSFSCVYEFLFIQKRSLEPILFFYEWELVTEDPLKDELVASVASGLLLVNDESQLSQVLTDRIKRKLEAEGHNTISIANGRLLNIRRV